MSSFGRGSPLKRKKARAALPNVKIGSFGVNLTWKWSHFLAPSILLVSISKTYLPAPPLPLSQQLVICFLLLVAYLGLGVLTTSPPSKLFLLSHRHTHTQTGYCSQHDIGHYNPHFMDYASHTAWIPQTTPTRWQHLLTRSCPSKWTSVEHGIIA